MIETAVRTVLSANTTVNTLVVDRIYTGIMPQRPTMPLIVLTKVDKLSDLTMADAVGPNIVRVQVDCWDDDVDGVRALADAVNGNDDQSSRGALHGYAGTSAGVPIKLLRLLVERVTDYEPETQLYRVSADYAAHL